MKLILSSITFPSNLLKDIECGVLVNKMYCYIETQCNLCIKTTQGTRNWLSLKTCGLCKELQRSLFMKTEIVFMKTCGLHTEL